MDNNAINQFKFPSCITEDIKIVKGVILNHEELVELIKEVFPDVYNEYDDTCPNGIMSWVEENCLGVGQYNKFYQKDSDEWDEYTENTEKLGGLNIFMWKHGDTRDFNENTFVLGKLVSFINVNAICASAYTFTGFPEIDIKVPEMFSSKPIQYVYVV